VGGLESTLRATLNERHVHIYVHEEIVTVGGEVRTEMDRERIDSLIRNTRGVLAVKDELKVTLPN
jgi:osmotically-inducible protein OsmY